MVGIAVLPFMAVFSASEEEEEEVVLWWDELLRQAMAWRIRQRQSLRNTETKTETGHYYRAKRHWAINDFDFSTYLSCIRKKMSNIVDSLSLFIPPDLSHGHIHSNQPPPLTGTHQAPHTTGKGGIKLLFSKPRKKMGEGITTTLEKCNKLNLTNNQEQ